MTRRLCLHTRQMDQAPSILQRSGISGMKQTDIVLGRYRWSAQPSIFIPARNQGLIYTLLRKEFWQFLKILSFKEIQQYTHTHMHHRSVQDLIHLTGGFFPASNQFYFLTKAKPHYIFASPLHRRKQLVIL